MKKIFLIAIILFSIKGMAQDLSERKVEILSIFDINISNHNLQNPQVLHDLRLIVKKDRRRKLNKTMGIIFTALGALTITSGAVALA